MASAISTNAIIIDSAILIIPPSGLATATLSVPSNQYAIVTIGTTSAGSTLQFSIGSATSASIPSGTGQLPITNIYVGPGQTLVVSSAVNAAYIVGVMFRNVS